MEWKEAFEVVRGLTDFWPTIRVEKMRAGWALARDVRKDEGCIVDLGTAHGLSAITLALGARAGGVGAKVYTIDDRIVHEGWAGEQYVPTDEETFRRNVESSGIGPAELCPLIGDSIAIAGEWPEEKGPVGLVFWDLSVPQGDVNYFNQRVAADFAAWAPHMARGGVFAVKHCCGPRDIPGVTGAPGWSPGPPFDRGLVRSVRRAGASP